MLGWAFAHGTSLTPIGKLVQPGDGPTPSQPLRQLAPPPATTTSALEVAGQPMLRAWIGLVGGISALAMAGAWARRSISASTAEQTSARRTLSAPAEAAHRPDAAGKHTSNCHDDGTENDPGGQSRSIDGPCAKRR